MEYVNLPQDVAINLINYSDIEKWENYIEVLECLFALHASMTPGADPHASMALSPDQITSHMSIMPSDEINEAPTASEFEKLMKQYSSFKKEDPSPYYDIVGTGKLGVGGFAKVYKAKRKSDGKICALKLCEPKQEEDW